MKPANKWRLEFDYFSLGNGDLELHSHKSGNHLYLIKRQKSHLLPQYLALLPFHHDPIKV